jgi:hypothetical protein
VNYSELTTLLQDTLQNSETSFVTHIPDFVRQAEEDIYRRVLIPELRRNAVGTLTASDRFLSKPTDYLAPSSLAVVDGSGDYSYLLYKDINFMRTAYPSISTEGTPRYYSSFDGDFFILAPTPSAALAVQLHYFYDPPSIVTASTSWLGDNAENALLYGAVVKAYAYLKGNPEKMAEYKSHYERAMQDLAKLGEFRNKRDSLRSEPRIET